MTADATTSPLSPRWSGVLFAGALATALWTPLAFGGVEPWAVGLIRLTACALVAVWAIGCAASMGFVLHRSALQAPIYLAALYAFVQSVTSISVDPFSSRQTALTLLALAVLFSCALVGLDRTSRLERAAWALFALGFGLSVFGLLQFLSGTHKLYWVRDSPVETFFGPFVNKNHFAGLMEVLLPMGLGLVATGAAPKERRPLVLFAGVVILTAVVFSRSRAGLLSVGVELVLLGAWAVAARSRRRAGGGLRAAVVGAALVVGVVGAVAWLGAEPVAQNITTLPGQAAATDPTSRLGIWSATAELVRRHPFVGSGLGAYGTAVTAVYPAPERTVLLYAHNDYLQVVADAGAIGALLAILFLVLLGKTAIRGVRRGDPVLDGVALGASVGCLGLVIHSVVDFNLQIPSNAVAFLFAAAMLVGAAGAPKGAGALARREV